jgi:AmmeMemoRadiSam system protein B
LAAEAFTINLADHYHLNFENFGNFSVKLDFKGETVLMVAAKELLNQKIPVGVISNPNLDHGIGVPLYYLARHLPEVSLAPIYFSGLDNLSHFEFGKGLKETVFNSNKRIAIIASGDLSHCLSKNAPAPFNPAGKKFDEKLTQLLEQSDSQSIINLDPQLIHNAAECGLRSILILLGILNGINYSTEILSYEAPFGVGYLVANFKLN